MHVFTSYEIKHENELGRKYDYVRFCEFYTQNGCGLTLPKELNYSAVLILILKSRRQNKSN